jgi:uncharacterized protein
MDIRQKYGNWALIAGSAEGLGRAWSVSLAKRGFSLIMIDHAKEKLMALSERLGREYGINTITLFMDLGTRDAAERMMEKVHETNCRLMVYNAAHSRVGPFIEQKESDMEDYAGVNIRTQLRLVHTFSRRLAAEGRGGGIILMSSLAGLMGMQLVAPYSATKAFAWNLAEALHHELKPHNIDVMACIAGATATPAYLQTDPRYGSLKPLVMEPDAVAAAALKKLGKRTLFIPGYRNRLSYFILTRLLPRTLASRIVNHTMEKMYDHHPYRSGML